ncbi:unnamed protein product [Amoebophrya sp. A120]|nr:unnamed protein product [Amoebophrya sp. A120]|eukprot:GSA120T00019294001.1
MLLYKIQSTSKEHASRQKNFGCCLMVVRMITTLRSPTTNKSSTVKIVIVIGRALWFYFA